MQTKMVTVLGTGSWGTALAQVLVDNGHRVRMWGIQPSQVDAIDLRHENPDFFGDHKLPEALTATTDLASALENADAVVIAVPTKAVADVLAKALPYLSADTLLINVAKGFDPTTDRGMSDTVRAVTAKTVRTPIASLVGPSHAEEVIERKLTSLCAVSQDEETARQVQMLFSGAYLRVYLLTDETGAECGAAAKNVVALAAGMLTGLGYGDNAKAALVTRGLCEILRYGMAMGGKKDTFFGLTGVGDLIVTCFSEHSRNFQAGLAIGRADTAKDFLAENTKTVEGIYSCKVIADLAKRENIDMPIILGIAQVLFEGAKPSEVVRSVMCRPLKAE